jgi:cytochrome c553
MHTRFLLPILGALALLGACRQDMHDQPKYKPQRGSSFFADGRSNRPLVPGTIARGRLLDDELLDTGKVGAEFSKVFPFEITKERLERGASRYAIFCSPCHDSTGSGSGMIVQRGMKQPVSFHIDRLREAAPGYYFDVMTNGFGAMYDYADRVSIEDRWAIAAYIRVLQRAQNSKLADAPPEIQKTLTQQSQ